MLVRKGEPDKIRDTTLTLYAENSVGDSKRTYIIFGTGNGSTTMVAGAARACGLDIGSNLPSSLEDNDFNSEVLASSGIKPIPHIVSALQQRQSANDVWGWKYHKAIIYLDRVRHHLINPHLILVSRDPIALATRRMRSGSNDIDSVELLLRLQLANTALIKKWKVPTLIVSYEKAMQYRDHFIDDLCKFLGVEEPGNRSEVTRGMSFDAGVKVTP